MWSWSEPWFLFAPIMLAVCIALLYVMMESESKYNRHNRGKPKRPRGSRE